MGLKKNIVYSAVLQGANYIFQFITFPYASRVLGPDGIGLYNYATSIVQYFMLFAAMGILNLGTREIAKCTSQQQLNLTFSKLLVTNILISLGVLVIYIPLIFLIPQFYEIKAYLFIGIFQIIFNAITIEWLFRGIQNFKFITLRAVIIRIIYVILVFVLVNNHNDVMTYYLLSVLTLVANGIINWKYAKRATQFIKVNIIDSLNQYLKPMFLLGSQALISFFYVGFNTVYLGFICNEAQVGYFSTATKIIIIILALYTAYSTAMMPKLSSLVASGNKEQESYLIYSSIELLCCFSFPLIIILLFYSDLIIYLIAGSQYNESISILTIGAPLILILGLNQILFVQVLLPRGHDKAIAKICLYGASVGILLNIILVGYLNLQSLGSIITWFTAESIVIAVAILYLRKIINPIYFIKKLLHYGSIYLPLGILVLFVNIFITSRWFSLACAIVAIIIYSHIAMIYLIKQNQYLSLIHKFKHI
ncbi:oligosaccharide flippase family protein [uncultured Duncaniella sp.]|uniref:oligosaccharide flippase family protein n=1 Tax=uncultured Duncaniella sp. TaxID=2768039 RepID=UPI0025B7211B|nr:oligosaccharide flippase family protein [uncultured Duncaniella sp.]